MKTTKYGLRSKKSGKLIGFSTEGNSEDCEGVSVTYSLLENAVSPWLVDFPEHAEYVRLNSTDWYNADYKTPINPYESDELEVVRVEQIIEPVKVKIPTAEEYLKLSYLNKDLKYYDPKHYEYCMKNISRMAIYSFYDLIELIGKD